MNGNLIWGNKILPLLAMLGLAIGAGQAKADLLIDNFSGTNAPASPTINSGIAPTSYSGASGNPNYWSMAFSPFSNSIVNSTVAEPAGIAGVLSGWGRSTNVSAANANGAFPVYAVVESLLAVNTGAATDTTLTYNGGTPTSTPQNFTGTTGFALSFTSIDHASVPILITIEDSSGKTESATGITTFSGSGVATIPLSSFSNTPGFNLASLTQFQASIDGAGIQDLNYRLGAVSVDMPASTPEPATLILLAAGAVGLAGWKLRKRTRASFRARQPSLSR